MVDISKNQKHNILIIFNSLIGTIGGGSRHIVHVTDYWSAQNHIDFLISKSGFAVAEEYIKEYSNPNKKIILYSTPLDKYKRKEFNKIWVYLSRLISSCLLLLKSKDKYDIIISANYQSQNTLPALIKKIKNKKSKLVVYIHESSPYFEKKPLILKLLSKINWNLNLFLIKKYFDKIILVNKDSRNHFIKSGFSSEKLFLSSNGIKYKEILKIDSQEKEFDGVFLGRLVNRKGVHDLLKIWKIVLIDYPNAKLCIIGEGEEREKLERNFKQAGLEKNIVLAGKISDNEKYAILKKSKVFVFPSYQEGWGIVIAEALSCGLPVVAYNLEVYKEVFNNCVIGVELGNPKKMANEIINVFNNLSIFERTSEEGKKFVSKYDWQKVADLELSNLELLF
jgi:glycosyltransferase involved in cell wall biosynthesis